MSKGEPRSPFSAQITRPRSRGSQGDLEAADCPLQPPDSELKFPPHSRSSPFFLSILLLFLPLLSLCFLLQLRSSALCVSSGNDSHLPPTCTASFPSLHSKGSHCKQIPPSEAPGEVTGGQACSPGQPALSCSLLGREPSLAWRCLPLQGQWSRVQSCLPTQGGFLRFPGLPFPANQMQKADRPPSPPAPPPRPFLWSSGCSVFPPLSSALDASL